MTSARTANLVMTFSTRLAKVDAAAAHAIRWGVTRPLRQGLSGPQCGLRPWCPAGVVQTKRSKRAPMTAFSGNWKPGGTGRTSINSGGFSIAMRRHAVWIEPESTAGFGSERRCPEPSPGGIGQTSGQVLRQPEKGRTRQAVPV